MAKKINPKGITPGSQSIETFASALSTDPVNMFKRAAKSGKTLSGFVEQECPSDKGDLPAFSRLLEHYGIMLRDMPDYGIYSSKIADILDPDDPNEKGKLIAFVELTNRLYKSALTGKGDTTRSTYYSTDSVVGSIGRPYFDDPTLYETTSVGTLLSLDEFVGVQIPINSADYRAMYLDTSDLDKLRYKRITEGADIPTVTLTSSDKTTQLNKYGRGIRYTYEAMRRSGMRMVEYQKHLSLIAMQAIEDKINAILTILINGDENFTPTSVNLSNLGDGPVTNLSYKAWTDLAIRLPNKFMPTAVYTTRSEYINLFTLNTGTANFPYFMGGEPTSPRMVFVPPVASGMRIMYPSVDDTVAQALISNKLVMFDKRYAIKHIIEVSSTIQEIERQISNQTETIYMSEVEAFCIMRGDAIVVVDLAQ